MKPLGILLRVATDLFVEKQSVAQLLQGHDYRIDGEIFAGEHHDFGISKEVHLPCNVN